MTLSNEERKTTVEHRLHKAKENLLNYVISIGLLTPKAESRIGKGSIYYSVRR
jgi:hypothetical protein